MQLGAGVNPTFVIQRTSPTLTNLVSGLFPVLNVNIALLLNLRTILGSGSVTLTADVQLNAGDVIGIFYEHNEKARAYRPKDPSVLHNKSYLEKTYGFGSEENQED